MYLAQNLKYLREQRGLKQQELADILGVKQSTVGNWEAGKREPEINMLVCIAEYFNVSLDNLVLKDLKPPTPRYAENLFYFRKKLNLSQKDIGDFLGVTPKCVSKLKLRT